MTDISEKEYMLIRDYAKTNLGIFLNEKKKSLITTRLGNRIKRLGLKTIEEYYNYLTTNHDEIVNFTNLITTNYTYFMREAEHFKIFYDDVLPQIKKNEIKNKDLRVWCAGCSAGQESNYLGILVDKFFKNTHGWNTQILASDISTDVLEKAYYGKYAADDVTDVPNETLNNYFVKSGDEYQVIESVRKNIVYRKINLIDPFKFKKPLQVIFCRNVMIYFDDEVKEKVVKQFYDALEPGGFLFISHSETLNTIKSDFKLYKPAVYRKEI